MTAESIIKVHFIDVDQGDAALLEFPCGAVLIDAGGQNNSTTKELASYLKNFFDRRTDLESTLDTIFVTHTHVDHNRALKAIVEDSDIAIKNYVHNGEYNGSGKEAARWMRDHANDDGRQIKDHIVSQSEILPLPRTSGLADETIDPIDCSDVDPQIRILAGPYEENPGWAHGEFEDGNNKSLVVRIDYGETSFLFTGDLEEAAIETLVEYYDGTDLLDVDVYQVGHHGSRNGTTDSMVKSMTPAIAVFSMGPAADRRSWTAWQYGHPRRSIVEMLDRWIERPRAERSWVRVASRVKDFFDYEMRDAVYGTGWDRTIVISADVSGNMRVETLGQPGPS
ncbi:MAG: MBL fold metallo-hydrolase [Hyphomicrobiales bacterium]|nr:MBL fold metallo-hydrolase [Hyphomicrobiales bacterium]